MATFTSRRFNQDASGAKRAAANGPVFITDRGRPAHVLMTIEDYRRLAGDAPPAGRTLADMLALDGVDDLDEVLEQVRAQLRSETPRPADFD